MRRRSVLQAFQALVVKAVVDGSRKLFARQHCKSLNNHGPKFAGEAKFSGLWRRIFVYDNHGQESCIGTRGDTKNYELPLMIAHI
jgi:hypothetical protein